MIFIRDFKDIAKNDVALAGGKGASLGELIQAGIPVPPGFVILAPAFEHFLELTDLSVEIDAILHAVNTQEMHTIENAAQKIQALILSANIPKEIADEIMNSMNKLGAKFVAVRSSATAEDSASAAWAGQLETYLNTTQDQVLENVKKCWASLFTPRAIFYRFEKELHAQKISVAVVVQEMVESEMSGVAFSVHPVTQDSNQLIIEAGFGLGEAIVSGQITPDSYVVEKEPRRIIDKNIHEQTKGLYRAQNSGNEWQDIAKEKGIEQVLSDEEILELSTLILRIENHYGFPCDIEWAFERGIFNVVQSRPITTLDATKFIRIFKKFFTRKVPLVLIEYWHKGEYEVLHRILKGATHFNPLFLRDKDGQVGVYYDINNDNTALQPLINFVLKNPNEFFHLADEYEKTHSQFLKLIDKSSLYNLEKVFNLLLKLWGFMPVLVQMGELEDSALDKKIVKRASELRIKSQEKDAQVEDYFRAIVNKQFPNYSECWDVLRLSEILSNELPTPEELNKRKQGFIFFEQKLVLNKNRRDFEKEFLVKLDDSIQVIGESINKIIFEKSITRDWPLFIVEMLHKGFTDEFQKQMGFRYSEVLFDMYADHLDIYRVPAEHFEKMRAFILSKLAADRKFVSKCSETLLGYYKEFLRKIDDIDKSDLTKFSDQELAILLKDFIAVHTRLEPTFVVNFWFPIHMENYPEKTKWDKEISVAAKTRVETEKVGPEGDRIARKFAQEISKRMFGDEKYSKFISLLDAYNFLLDEKLVDKSELEKRMNGFVFGANGIKFSTVEKYAKLEGYEVKTAEVGEGKIVKGNVGYPGKVRGRVRIIISKEKIGIVEEGDILVTAMTTPEFMPALKKAAAFVTDEGGITSHAAIVSRELKKPCVIATKIATQVFQDGDFVEVNADAGIVRKIHEKSSAYVRLFELSGMPFLINSLALEHYRSLFPITIFRNNLWTSFLPKRVVEKTLQEGIELFSHQQLFDRYQKDFTNYVRSSKKFFDKIISSTEITRDQLEQFFSFFSQLWLYYKKTEFFYVDDAYIQSSKNQIIAKNLKKLEQIKNDGRQYLNVLTFGNASYLHQVLKILSTQFKIDVNDLFWYSPDEIIKLLAQEERGEINIQERQRAYVFWMTETKLQILEGKQALAFIDSFVVEEKNNVLKGVVANPGVVKARATVMKYGADTFDSISQQIRKMKKGDILVAETTSPELMVACKKASAILTNQGGLLSHAAIISRELNIPCIVGLETITHVVHDGDLLEVNANEGIVRIIESKN